jgi:periplasmic protein CpxP/Spy
MKGHKMKALFKPLLAATILSLSIANVAMAKPNQGHDKPHHCAQKENHARHDKNMQFPHQPRFLRGIDLTDVQKDKLFELNYAEMPTLRSQMKARHQLKQELMQLSDNYSEEKAKTIADKLATLERDSVLARARHQQQVLSLLTPEQRKQVSENKEKFKQRRDARPDNAKTSQRMQLEPNDTTSM